MEITYYGHAAFRVKLNEVSLVFDPFITPNPNASDVDVNEIKADYMLLSHGHEDHVADVSEIYKNGNPLIISSFEVVSWFQNQGLSNAHPMNHGGKKDFDFGSVKMVNAVHSSSMPDGSYGGNPAGFIVRSDGGTFYYAGDTALTYDMKLIADEFSIDFAFLPIGDNFTMGIDDAIKAAKFVGTSKVYGMHYDTFPIIEIDKDKAIKKFSDNQIELILLKIGESTINN
jgi:L-ascorbate metabolism protein UlaG (beta-lactamase superfamily)